MSLFANPGTRKANALNTFHMLDPQPGDYWHDCYAPACVIVGVGEDHLLLLRHTMQTEDNRWTWDVDQLEAMKIIEFQEWICYKSPDMKHKPWGDVIPLYMKKFRELVFERHHPFEAP